MDIIKNCRGFSTETQELEIMINGNTELALADV